MNLKKYFLIAMIISLALICAACGDVSKSNNTGKNIYEASKNEPITNPSGLFYYTYSNTPEIWNFVEQREKLSKDLKKFKDSKYEKIKFESSMFGTGHYALTTKGQPRYYYIGETKDNRPHGVGILFTNNTSIGSGGSNHLLMLYRGNFKNGVFDGFGQLYYVPDSSKEQSRESWGATEESSGFLNRFVDYLQKQEKKVFAKEERIKLEKTIISNYINRIKHEGYFEDGCYSKEGNAFDYFVTGPYNNPKIKLYIMSSKFKKVDVNDTPVTDSEVVKYMVDDKRNAHIYYKGTLDSDGRRDGSGTSYYENGKIEYQGEYKNDKYHGKGVLYDEKGNKKYDGKWKNGDYAN